MEIKELKIEGFKSLGSIQLNDLNPFTVFVGPNGAGKSNIFEALEFFVLCNTMYFREVLRLYGKNEEFINTEIINYETNVSKYAIGFDIKLDRINPTLKLLFDEEPNGDIRFVNAVFAQMGKWLVNTKQIAKEKSVFFNDSEYVHFFNFTRIFVQKAEIIKKPVQDDSKLASDASNLEKVLKRILKNEIYKAEIEEILQLLIPGFDRIDVVTEELSGTENLIVYEQSLRKPLTKRLISDGTYNIIALITAIYQSDVPQFLCIEEPENGLNPKVVRELVNIIRQKCEEKGHFIWLNTHSQTLVSELRPEEIVLVDKVDGLTQVKQIKGIDLHGLKMDEALLTNALGGGIPW